ncbi:ATPase [Candidatus Kaiserbacteria bacterium]|nr:ATPase [Candidatus Kaiserbacteria bacterium]
MLITKRDGTKEPFDPKKLERSLRRAGATKAQIDRVTKQVTERITEGMTTGAIYRHAFKALHKETVPPAAKYSLSRAVADLGPTGFPFEDFLARMFQREGYDTKTRIIMKGKCASHEIDVAGYSKDKSFIAEAKFHSRGKTRSDIQTTLYSYARYLDLKALPVCSKDTCGVTDLMLITNTRFTKAAVDYAKCAGLELLSWRYPKKNTLQDRIARAGVFPITVLSTLTRKEKAVLLEQGVVICSDIIKKPHILDQYGLARGKREAVIAEARQLCHGMEG